LKAWCGCLEGKRKEGNTRKKKLVAPHRRLIDHA